MGYFVKGQGLLPVVYKSDVKIGSVTIPSAGKFLARSYGLDGASLIDVQLGELPRAITDFIGGNVNVTSMIVPPSVSNVKGVFAPVFPNLAKVFLGSAANDATLKDGLDTAYAGLNVDVYVLDTLLAGYQTKYASATNLTFVAVTSTVALEIPYVGESTLTADYVRQVAGDLGALASAFEKVVVPVEFTAYESGSIQAIIDNFSSLTTLTTCYEAGNIDLDMNGDIVAKIVEIGKTVDEALCYAKILSHKTFSATPNLGISIKDSEALILPPLNNEYIFYSGYIDYEGTLGRSPTRKIVMIDCGNQPIIVNGNTATVSGIFSEYYTYDPHCLVSLKAKLKLNGTYLNYLCSKCTILKSVDLDFSSIQDFSNVAAANAFQDCSSLETIKLHGLATSFDISVSTKFTRQALIDLFNSLGTPSTTQTLTIGANNLAKLTAEDIAIATAKNWNVQ